MKINVVCRVILIAVAIEMIASSAIAADDSSTYLIMNDILPYKRVTTTIDIITEKTKTIPGYTVYNHPGVLAGADHFPDHSDKSYETDYQNKEAGIGVGVQVTHHAGLDSDKWLLHEVEIAFRDSGIVEAGPSEDTMLRSVNNSKLFFYGGGVVAYRWVSKNVVVNIQYTNLSGSKQEPIEVVQAYVQRFPSTIPTALVLDSDHDVQWIKDEMERRLWLCDKWFSQTELMRANQKKVLQEQVKSMKVFLDYREKYFGITAKDEKNVLEQYLYQNDSANIQAKLKAYKDWWAAHKGDSINL